MPVSRTHTKDAIFPHVTIQPASNKPEDIAEFVRYMVQDIRNELNFDRTLQTVEELARSVIASHPGCVTADGTPVKGAPAAVEEAATLLERVPEFRRALEGDDPREAGERGFFVALLYGHLEARQYEGVAATGRAQKEGASKGGKERSRSRRWTLEQAQAAEDAVAREQQNDPSAKMFQIQDRVASTFGLSGPAMLGRIRRAKESSRRN